jgi:hypothetical protein
MPLPKAVDAVVRSAFKTVLEECSSFVRQVHEDDVRPPPGPDPGLVEYGRMVQRAKGEWPPVDAVSFSKLQHDALALFEMIGGGHPPLSGAAEQVRALEVTMGGADRMLGILRSADSSYRRGLLEPLFTKLEAALAGDYLTQAEELLEEGQRGKCDHVPAAVILGAVFERKLRALCTAQAPPIELQTSNGEPKKVNVLIEELKKAGAYGETRAKDLRWIAGVRNHAAHGEFDKFTRNDVERMRTAVGHFIEEA